MPRGEPVDPVTVVLRLAVGEFVVALFALLLTPWLPSLINAALGGAVAAVLCVVIAIAFRWVNGGD